MTDDTRTRLDALRTPEEQLTKDLATLRRSLPTIVGEGTAELWMAFGRIEKAVGRGPYALQDQDALREAAQNLVDDWVGDDDFESEPFCWTCGMRRDLPHDASCTFVALRAALYPKDGTP